MSMPNEFEFDFWGGGDPAVGTLRLNVGETAFAGLKEQRAHQQRMRAMGRAGIQRHVMLDTPNWDLPLDQRAVNIRTMRWLLRPDHSPDHDIENIVLRIPLAHQRETIPERAYLEAIHRNPLERERYALVKEGLFLYSSAADLEASMHGTPEPLQVVEFFSHLMAEVAFDLQTSRTKI